MEREDEASIGRSPYSISPTDIPNVLKREVMGALKKVKSWESGASTPTKLIVLFLGIGWKKRKQFYTMVEFHVSSDLIYDLSSK